MAGPTKDTAEREQAAAVAQVPQLWEEDVARRAYEIYLRRGGGGGQEQEDWLQAEAELRAERVARGSEERPSPDNTPRPASRRRKERP